MPSNALLVEYKSAQFFKFNGTYVSESSTWVNGRRTYRTLDGPYELYYSCQHNSWEMDSDPRAVQEKAIVCETTTGSIYPARNSFESAPISASTLFGDVSIAKVIAGNAPSVTNMVMSKFVGQTRTKEVQKITVTTHDGLCFGGYSLDFNMSNTLT
jgi:hypothetical protein